MKQQHNVPTILKDDGVAITNLEMANQEVLNVRELIDNYGRESSWAHTVVNTESNSATLICQQPGEGNREHLHPDWNEWWYILEGEWEWLIEGKLKKISAGEIVFIEKGRKHKITAIGNAAAIRLAVSRYDVIHQYDD